ncbi:MAG TPA: hydroxymethylbilane synthase [Pyrinomonadaceae bacterium]|nr:hydroxymethylbilane synthase [Pyrinomonadaceae bacterium]
MKDHLVIGSRGSKLALWQAEWVKAQLRVIRPHVSVRIEIIKTSGDVLKDTPLAIIGGQGVFTKELEEALLDGRIDLAVHSLKDLPTTLPGGLAIAAITEREDARDALVLRAGESIEAPSIRRLPEGSVVGTSSLRRLVQLKHLRPGLGIKDLRGNVDTRLRKLDAGEYTAVILASAGLRRLGLADRISAYIEPSEMLPAVGQGALAVETRAEDAETIDLLAPLDHGPTRAACVAERALLRALGGGCQLPIAAHAFVRDHHLRIEGLVAGLSGETVVREVLEGEAADAAQLGDRLAARLLELGADSLLSGLKLQEPNPSH